MRVVLCLAALLAWIEPALAQQAANCRGPVALEQAVARDPSPDALNALGAYFAQHKQLACAIASFERALRLDPNSWQTRYNLALALLDSGDRKAAAQQLRRVVEKKPDLLHARNALGTVLQDLGEPEAAVEQFRAALNIDPRSI